MEDQELEQIRQQRMAQMESQFVSRMFNVGAILVK